MNRPNYDDYEHTQYEQSIHPYCRDLEIYCDALEEQLQRELEGRKVLIEMCEEALAKWKELNKALDRACTELDLSNKQLIDLDSRFI